MNLNDRVLKIIKAIRKSHNGAVDIYTQGKCYDFFLILKSIFPIAEAYYDSDHIITKIEGKYYDITGEVEKVNHLSVNKHYSHKKIKNSFKK